MLLTREMRLDTSRMWYLQTEGESRPMPFSEVFHLANVSGSWVVTNGKHHGRWQMHSALTQLAELHVLAADIFRLNYG